MTGRPTNRSLGGARQLGYDKSYGGWQPFRAASSPPLSDMLAMHCFKNETTFFAPDI